MYEKILAKLVAKFPGLPKKFLETWAKKMAIKVTEEEKIDPAVAALDDLPVTLPELAAEMQKEADRRVTEATKDKDKGKDKDKTGKKPKKVAKDPDDDSEDDDDEDQDEDGNKTIKQVLKEMKAEITSLRKERSKEELSSKLNKKLTEKGIPLKFAKGLVTKLESDEDIEAAVTEAEADYAEVKQSLLDSKMDQQRQPGGGASGGSHTPKPTGKEDADIQAWAKDSKPKAEQKVA
jgi:hypothetical protein